MWTGWRAGGDAQTNLIVQPAALSEQEIIGDDFGQCRQELMRLLSSAALDTSRRWSARILQSSGQMGSKIRCKIRCSVPPHEVASGRARLSPNAENPRSAARRGIMRSIAVYIDASTWAMGDSNSPQRAGVSGGISPRDAQSDARDPNMAYLTAIWDSLPEATRQYILAIAKREAIAEGKG